MEGSNLMQEMYAIGKRLEELKIFHRAMPFNNTEMQMMREIIAAKERGSRVISSGLAKLLGITRSAVSQMVKKLESKGVVRRVPDSRDKKIAYIELSDKARSIYEESRARVNGLLERIVAKLGEEKVEHFITGTNEFIDAFCEATEEADAEL
ncbi:MAG TPA: MarR family transcriptional regulator [Candidatus Borkfalkia avicola]|uniref:MarR family transcriptional regulator n=1 Tax=Candidatus Borkfalkia avicola TaxID=2838503 RepID=A0A9D2D7G3_9FIRM|nr:MarR family transcriptional regulator [Candidatus Borkfalkia avicola]